MRSGFSRWWIFSLFTILFGGIAFGQSISCAPSSLAPRSVHTEGLSEMVGDVTVTCTGGVPGSQASLSMFVSLNTAITNRLDPNTGLPMGLTVTVNAVPNGNLQIYSPSTILINPLTYTVASTPVTITVSGLRAAPATLPAATSPQTVTATVTGIGNGINATFASAPVTVGIAAPTLLTSVVNGGVPCIGSPVPATIDFPTFISANVNSSTVRVTEASPAAFTVKDPGSDTGLRILVQLSGYTAGSRVFVPDAIVGTDGSTPTASGVLNTTPNTGLYTPGQRQLLLLRVAGATPQGTGGTFAPVNILQGTPFTTLSEISLTNGSGFVVYEVADSNPTLQESAQIPVYLTVPQTPCTGVTPAPSLSASIVPVSTVATATTTDPIPRFIATTPGSDCTFIGDCSASYFPKFTVDTTPIVFTGSSFGNRQGANILVSNAGGGFVNFSASVTYPSGPANWITVTPTSGQNSASLQVFADPSTLQPGTYTATIVVSAGSFGTFNVPVTFTVGAPGVVIQSVLNAASGTSPVAPGSYTAIYGLNLAGQNVAVTFTGFPATVIYDSATQINVIVPPGLGALTAADVVVTVDGKTSNSFKASLGPNAPGIFNPGIENADGSVNTSSNPAARGSFVAVYLTGLAVPLTGQVTVTIGGQTNLIPLYAGAQPTLTALDQVNVTVPSTLPATPNPVGLTVCIPGGNGQPLCSNAVNLYIK